MQPTTVRLPEPLMTALRAEAVRTGLGITEIVRAAVAAYLKKHR